MIITSYELGTISTIGSNQQSLLSSVCKTLWWNRLFFLDLSRLMSSTYYCWNIHNLIYSVMVLFIFLCSIYPSFHWWLSKRKYSACFIFYLYSNRSVSIITTLLLPYSYQSRKTKRKCLLFNEYINFLLSFSQIHLQANYIDNTLIILFYPSFNNIVLYGNYISICDSWLFYSVM